MAVFARSLARRTGARRALCAWASALMGELDRALYPRLCFLCRTRPVVDGWGCAEHALEAARIHPRAARCAGCAAPLPAGIPAGLCAACRRGSRGFRRIVAAGAYESAALRAWILAWKHGGRRDLAAPLAAFLAGARDEGAGPGPGDVLVPVPLHPRRRLARGFDQAADLTLQLAERLGLERLSVLRRTRWTPPQGAPDAAARGPNVAAVFALRARPAARLAGRRVWLVDDVVTSGATARACARVLLEGGAEAVSVLALARVAPPGLAIRPGGEPGAAG